MKKIAFIFLFLIAQFVKANDTIQISILTCSPGYEIYSVFGHSSIRVVDERRGIDYIYNFGMFKFDTPNFAMKFLKGKLEYFLAIQRTSDFKEIYTREGRSVSEQILDLPPAKKNEIVQRLNYLHLPANRYYYYSFLDKNCSTELRDILELIDVEFRIQESEFSYRDLLMKYLKPYPWMKFGINLIAGKQMSHKVDAYGSMFLPDYLEEEMKYASLNGKEILQATKPLNDIQFGYKFKINQLFSPFILFTLIALYIYFKESKALKITMLGFVGLLSMAVTFLMIYSEHRELSNNLNILWANPLYLAFIPFLVKNKIHIVLPILTSLCLLAAIIVWIFQVQEFDHGVIPIMLILGVLNYEGIRKWENDRQINR